MRSGGLRERVEIQNASVTQDALGYPGESWSTVATVWGEFNEERGSEILQNNRPVNFRRGLLFIRYRDDVTPKTRVVLRGITWQVETIRVLDAKRRREGLELLVRAND